MIGALVPLDEQLKEDHVAVDPGDRSVRAGQGRPGEQLHQVHRLIQAVISAQLTTQDEPDGARLLGALSDLGRTSLPLVPPEPAHPRRRRPLEQAAERPGIGPPRRLVALAVVGKQEGHQVEQRAQLKMLDLVGEGGTAGVRVGRPGDMATVPRSPVRSS